MNSKEKIEYMLHKVREKARISPYGVFYLNIEDEVTEEGKVLISNEDQISILEKFKKDDLLFGLEFNREGTRATVLLMYLDKENDENPYEVKNKHSSLEVKVLGGVLIFNKDTGFVGLNKTGKQINIKGQEFNFLKVLLESKDYRASYDDFLGKNAPKTKRRALGFSVRNLKKAIGILPKKKSKNKDIIRAVKNYGYELIT